MAVKTFREVLTETVVDEMLRNEAVYLIGEGVRGPTYGGDRFVAAGGSPERIKETPLSEAAFTGAAIGSAICGMRPVVCSLAQFMWLTMDQLVNQMSRLRGLFGGQINVPVVFRLGEAYGGVLPAHLEDRPHNTFSTIPGIKIVVPTTPADAKGLMLTALRGNDPVVVFEDLFVANVKGEVPDGDGTIPFGVGDVKREGTDATIVAIGGMVPLALHAAEQLAGQGVSVEVIDPRTLVPLDLDIILNSVAKTGRLVIVDSAPRNGSTAGHISSLVAEEGFYSLKAPIACVTAADANQPFSRTLPPLMYPSVEKIVGAINLTLEKKR